MSSSVVAASSSGAVVFPIIISSSAIVVNGTIVLSSVSVGVDDSNTGPDEWASATEVSIKYWSSKFACESTAWNKGCDFSLNRIEVSYSVVSGILNRVDYLDWSFIHTDYFDTRGRNVKYWGKSINEFAGSTRVKGI